MKIAVLVTTMHQTDLSKYKTMNLKTDAVIANQTDCNIVIEELIEKNHAIFVSTTTRGVSRNRNIALAHTAQDTEIIVFSDDDLVFNDRYDDLIENEFNKHPEAEAIKFNLHDLSISRKISMKRIEKFEKATRRNMSSSGVCGLAIRHETIREKNLRFHEFFGPGTDNYCGEDTIFLMDLIDKGVQFYRSPVDIAGINQAKSSWFTGFDEKYFVTSGMVIGTIYPLLSYLITIRSAFKFSRRKEISLNFLEILKCYYNGIKNRTQR